jgi:hypothetical protein
VKGRGRGEGRSSTEFIFCIVTSVGNYYSTTGSFPP